MSVVQFVLGFSRQTLWRSPSRGDGVVWLLGTCASTAGHFYPKVGETLAPYLWQIPLWGVATVFAWRFVTAPYHLWKEQSDRADVAEARASAATDRNVFEEQQATRAERVHREKMDAQAKIASALLEGTIGNR